MSFSLSKKNIIILIIGIVTALVLTAGVVALILKGNKDNDFDDVSSEIFSSEAIESVAESSTQPVPEKLLNITSPKTLNSTVTSSKTYITGTSDIEHPVLMNGKEIERAADGTFNIEVTLSVGKNSFTFEHKGVKTVCNITYRYVVIDSYYPKGSEKYDSGSTFVVTAHARRGSSVKATFNGTTITLKEISSENDEEFTDFTGSFTLPDKNDSDLNLGKIKFVGVCGTVTESFYSGNITCLKNKALAGRSYVAEVVAFTAETFSGSTTDDYSNPKNNYLPKGTLDYCDSGIVYDAASKSSYYRLRCGRRVYVDKYNDDKSGKVTVTSRYKGTLPDHNEISVANFGVSGKHTVLTLDTDWKAPFLLDLYPQSYANPSVQDFSVSSVTFEYVEIKFCYASVFSGEIKIPKSNPLFSSAEIVKSGDSHILRLYLKGKGKFCGWDAYYNSKNQLCFEFLNPTNTVDADNAYGINLTGVKILIDAGHGGRDPGAVRGSTQEEERNLSLARKLKSELESIGATVVMTRTGDYTVGKDERQQMLKNIKPDYCISIHHNSLNNSSVNGFEAYHFNAFSKNAVKMVYDRTMQSGLYNNSKLKSHYFFLSRITTCPVVLTENGYLGNTHDYNNIISESANLTKAKAMVRGIADYFKSIRYTPVEDDPPAVEPPVESEPNPPIVDPPIESEPPSSDVPPQSDTSSDSTDTESVPDTSSDISHQSNNGFN